MERQHGKNILAIAAVAVIVAGAAYFKAQRNPSTPAEADSTPADSGAPAVISVKEGELCPDGIPATQVVAGGEVPSQTASQAEEATKPSAAAHASKPEQALRHGDLLPRPPTSQSAEAAPSTQVVAKRPRMVDLGAGKCKACIALAPILEELKKEYAGRVDVEFIDVWKDPKAGDPYKIRVIPTQIFYDRDGKETWRHEGFLPKEDFVKKFAELGVK